MNAFSSTDAYISKLYKRGFHKVGSGLFAVVLAKPGSDRVIKVALASDMWPEYVEWATLNAYAGKFAPKVYSLKFHNGFYVAVMERLVCTLQELEKENNYSQNTQYHILAEAIKYWSGYSRYCKPDIMPNCPDLQAFSEAAGESGMFEDLHGGNIMLRNDGQIVVTDPSSSMPTKPKLRIKGGNVIQASE